MSKPLPFQNVALPQHEPGVEVRFEIERDSVAGYSILYRLPNAEREHRWSGVDALPQAD